MRQAKQYPLFHLLFLIVSSANTNLYCQPKNDWTIENLKGKVRAITTSVSTRIIPGEYFQSQFRMTKINAADKTEFDSTGNINMITGYDKHHNITETYKYVYDSNGYVTKGFYHDKNDSLNYTYTYKYNKNGESIEQYYYNSKDSLIARDVMKYNEGFLVASFHYYPLDTLRTKEYYDYEQDTLVTTKKYIKGQVLSFQCRYEYSNYDTEGNWQKLAIFLINSGDFAYITRKIEYY